MMLRLSVALVAAAALISGSSYAASTIRFPETDLPQETVRPIFDRRDVVMNPYVKTKRRLELGLLGGWTPTDPFFSPYSYGFTSTYHINEHHGVNLQYTLRVAGTTEYTEQLNTVRNIAPLKLQNAPATKSVGLLTYQLNFFYGKISLTKTATSHLSTFATAGPAMIQLGDSTTFGFALGLGQKYYFTRYLALRLDARILAYEGPNILSRSLSQSAGEQPSSTFTKRMYYDSVLGLSLVFLFPAI